MAWQAAIPLVVNGLQYCTQAYAVGSNNETTRESERIKAMIRSLEMQRDMESIQAQKEILQSLIQAATYMFERKMDYFQEAFRTFAQHLAHQRQALNEEKIRLEAGLFNTALPKEERFLLFKRIGDISRELADLDTKLRERNREIDDLVFRLTAQLPHPSPLPGRLS